MAVTAGLSFLLSSVSALLIFSGMQMYKPWLVSSQIHTIFGGYLGSIFFVLCLTAVGNLEVWTFGKSFQMKIFPEVVVCLLVALFTSAAIHRVCATSCVLISLCSLYYLNNYSQRIQVPQAAPVVMQTGKKKK